MKVLIVDDDPLVRGSCRRILERDGFSCSVAAGGAEALEYVRRAAFDAALVDLKMPGMSGMEVLRRLREESSNTAVIIVTGHASIDSAIEAVKAGAFDYLPKPLSPEVLTARVRRAVRAVRKELAESLIRKELEREKLTGRPPALGRVARLIQGDATGEADATGADAAQGSLARMEAVEIRNALRLSHGNKTKAAQQLGINRKTLREKMQKYGIVHPKA
ncbi:MAG: DNA-binding response regulator [Acidobacteriota bacterium]|jgi:DNA-binding NtrC family response regulator|nr:DNA-binding response regulator [Acidobacteriota bacterium]